MAVVHDDAVEAGATNAGHGDLEYLAFEAG